MKVILLQDLKGRGKKNDVINVSDGYANNFLIPQKIATPADSRGLNEAKQKKQAEKDKEAKRLADAKDTQLKLNGATIEVKVKCGLQGKIFGSVTGKEIADSLVKNGYNIDKKSIVLKEPIKQLGRLMVDVKIYAGVSARINVVIVPEE